jgi:extradiol dioxygenase family protein
VPMPHFGLVLALPDWYGLGVTDPMMLAAKV